MSILVADSDKSVKKYNSCEDRCIRLKQRSLSRIGYDDERLDFTKIEFRISSFQITNALRKTTTVGEYERCLLEAIRQSRLHEKVSEIGETCCICEACQKQVQVCVVR
ncbi:hypothetical protein B9Z55_002516 [Caenorhabditis nigoni]|uniref:Uncharacterized protein n=1 Tax=Caenorhabditis nigoni TaxID=1611254 RepID=A0A2G5VKZ8_9PELO|nr:hypothetical protein B9Z55_002516 [Caenorhabditis nigoni]